MHHQQHVQGQVRARPISSQGGVPLWKTAEAVSDAAEAVSASGAAEAVSASASGAAEAASDVAEGQDDLKSCYPSRWP